LRLAKELEPGFAAVFNFETAQEAETGTICPSD